MLARWQLAGLLVALGAAPASAQESVGVPREEPARVEAAVPPPLHSRYAQYGAAINPLVLLSPGAACGPPPCILGSGGGLVLRGGYRSAGPWYIGGGYSFAKLDSSNLLRLGVFQQAWGEMRYLFDTGLRATPYLTGGVGVVGYGNEWRVETGGACVLAGAGIEFEVSRLALVGLAFAFRPALIVGWTDSAGNVRPMGIASILGLEFQLEVRTELGRR